MVDGSRASLPPCCCLTHAPTSTPVSGTCGAPRTEPNVGALAGLGEDNPVGVDMGDDPCGRRASTTTAAVTASTIPATAHRRNRRPAVFVEPSPPRSRAILSSWATVLLHPIRAGCCLDSLFRSPSL